MCRRVKLKETHESSDSGAQIDCLWRQERNPFAPVLRASLVREEWTSLEMSDVGLCQALKNKVAVEKTLANLHFLQLTSAGLF